MIPSLAPEASRLTPPSAPAPHTPPAPSAAFRSLPAAIDAAVASEAAWTAAVGKGEAEQLRHACVLWRIKCACVRGDLCVQVVGGGGGMTTGDVRVQPKSGGGGAAWNVVAGSLKCSERTLRRLEIMARLVCDDAGNVVGAEAVKARQQAVKASMARHPRAWAIAGGNLLAVTGGVHANHPVLGMEPEAVMASGRRMELLGRAWLKACELASAAGAADATGYEGENHRKPEGAAPAMFGSDTERGVAARCAGGAGGADEAWEPDEGGGKAEKWESGKAENESGDGDLGGDEDEDVGGELDEDGDEAGELTGTRTAGEGDGLSGAAAGVCAAEPSELTREPAAGNGARRNGSLPRPTQAQSDAHAGPTLRLARDAEAAPRAEQMTMDALWERAEKVLALAAELSACVVRGDRSAATRLMRELQGVLSAEY